MIGRIKKLVNKGNRYIRPVAFSFAYRTRAERFSHMYLLHPRHGVEQT